MAKEKKVTTEGAENPSRDREGAVASLTPKEQAVARKKAQYTAWLERNTGKKK